MLRNTMICGLVVTTLDLGLYFYYVRELLAALILFSVAFFSLALAGLSAGFICYAGAQMAIRGRPLSQNMVAFSRRLIAVYARP
jgi:hypothetical protein